MTRIFLCAVLAAMAVPFENTAWAYACVTTSCAPHCQLPVQYKLGKMSEDLGANTAAEVQRGMEAWSKPTCTSLKTQYQGTTTETAASGNGIIDWVEAGWTYGTGTIGVTTTRASRGCLTSSMVMNGVNFKWVAAAPRSRGEVNAFTIIAHEGGHYFGLGHSSMTSAMMTPSYAGGVGTISADDQAGICKIYPAKDAPAVPGTGGMGGAGAGGAGGAPSPMPAGTGGLCAACKVGADCASGTCLRNNNSRELFCGSPCVSACPAGFACITVSGAQPVQRCAPMNGSCKGVVVTGAGGSDGASGGSSGAGGSGGSGGSGGVGGSVGSGGTGGGSAGSGGNANDVEGTIGSSGGNEGAVPVDETVTVADGEHCEVNDDCNSQLCLEQDKNTFCSRLCSSNADCVSGFACRDKGDERVCLPIDNATDNSSPAGGDGVVRGGCSLTNGRSQSGTAVLLGVLAIVCLVARTRRSRRR